MKVKKVAIVGHCILLASCLAALTGCTMLVGGTGESFLYGAALGEKTGVALTGINLTSEKAHTNGLVLTNGVGIDSATGQASADINGILGKLIIAGLQATPAAPVAAAIAPAVVKPENSEDCEDCEIK